MKPEPELNVTINLHTQSFQTFLKKYLCSHYSTLTALTATSHNLHSPFNLTSSLITHLQIMKKSQSDWYPIFHTPLLFHNYQQITASTVYTPQNHHSHCPLPAELPLPHSTSPQNPRATTRQQSPSNTSNLHRCGHATVILLPSLFRSTYFQIVFWQICMSLISQNHHHPRAAVKPPATAPPWRTHPHRAQLCELHLPAANHHLNTAAPPASYHLVLF